MLNGKPCDVETPSITAKKLLCMDVIDKVTNDKIIFPNVGLKNSFQGMLISN